MAAAIAGAVLVVAGSLVAVQLAGTGFGARTLPLPTVSGSGGACAGVGVYDATLRGDQNDPRAAWLEGSSGGRQDVVWPRGYTARFTPELEILDADGTVQLREGDAIDGGCVISEDPDAPLLIMP